MYLEIPRVVSNSQVQTFERSLLSNRCSFCIRNNFPQPTIPLSPSIGIDKVAIEIPLAAGIGDPKLFLSSLKNTLLGRWATKATTLHTGTGAKIEWQFLKTRWSIRIEFNPSRFIDPDGCTLATPNQTIHVIRELITEFMFESEDALPCFVITDNDEIDIENWNPNWMNLIRVSRLDTAIDFTIDNPRFDISNYNQIAPKYAKATSVTYSKKGQAETWTGVYSNKDGFPMLYDKTHQAQKKQIKQPPPIGTKRFEFRLGRQTLTRAHIHTLADVNHTKFEYALRQGWEYSNVGSIVHSPDSWMEIVTNSDLDPMVKASLIGFLTAHSKGIDLGIGDKESNQMKVFARNLGISFKMKLEKQSFIGTYLDLESQSLKEIKSSRLDRQVDVQ